MFILRSLIIIICLFSFSCLANCEKELNKINSIVEDWGVEKIALDNQYHKTLKELAKLRGISFTQMLLESWKIINKDEILRKSEVKTSEKSDQFIKNFARGYCKFYIPYELELIESLRENYTLKIKHFEKLTNQNK